MTLTNIKSNLISFFTNKKNSNTNSVCTNDVKNNIPMPSVDSIQSKIEKEYYISLYICTSTHII